MQGPDDKPQYEAIDKLNKISKMIDITLKDLSIYLKRAEYARRKEDIFDVYQSYKDLKKLTQMHNDALMVLFVGGFFTQEEFEGKSRAEELKVMEKKIRAAIQQFD